MNFNDGKESNGGFYYVAIVVVVVVIVIVIVLAVVGTANSSLASLSLSFCFFSTLYLSDFCWCSDNKFNSIN